MASYEELILFIAVDDDTIKPLQIHKNILNG